METGLPHDFLGIFSHEVKIIIFVWREHMRLKTCQVRLYIETNIEMKLGRCGPDGDQGRGQMRSREWGQSGRTGGSGDPYHVSHIPYLVSHLSYLVSHPLSDIPPLLSPIPSLLSGIPTPNLYTISPI